MSSMNTTFTLTPDLVGDEDDDEKENIDDLLASIIDSNCNKETLRCKIQTVFLIYERFFKRWNKRKYGTMSKHFRLHPDRFIFHKVKPGLHQVTVNPDFKYTFVELKGSKRISKVPKRRTTRKNSNADPMRMRPLSMRLNRGVIDKSLQIMEERARKSSDDSSIKKREDKSKKLKDRVNGKEVTVLKRKNKELVKKMSVLESNYAKLVKVKGDVKKLEDVIAERDTEIELLKQNEKNEDMKKELESLNEIIAMKEKKIKELETNDMTKTINDLKESLEDRNEAINEIKIETDELIASIEEKDKIIAELREGGGGVSNEKVKELEKVIEEKNDTIGQLEIEIEKLEVEKEEGGSANSDKKIKELEKIIEEKNDTIGTLEIEIEKLEVEKEEGGGGNSDEKVKELEKVIEQKDDAIGELEIEIEKLEVEKEERESNSGSKEKLKQYEEKITKLEATITELKQNGGSKGDDADNLIEIERLNNKVLALKDSLKIKEATIADLINELDEGGDDKKKIDMIRNELIKKDDIIRDLERQLLDHEDTDTERLNEKINDLTDSVKHKDRTIAKLKEELESKGETIVAPVSNDEVDELKQKINEKESVIRELEKHLEVNVQESETLSIEIEKKNATINELKEEIENLKSMPSNNNEKEEESSITFNDSYKDLECTLISPKTISDITRGEVNDFKIKCPNASEVLICIDDNEWNSLSEGSDNVFEGSVKIEDEEESVDIYVKTKDGSEKVSVVAINWI